MIMMMIMIMAVKIAVALLIDADANAYAYADVWTEEDATQTPLQANASTTTNGTAATHNRPAGTATGQMQHFKAMPRRRRTTIEHVALAP